MNSLPHRVMRFMRYLYPHKFLFAGTVLTGFIAAAASGIGIPGMVRYVFPVIFNHEVPAALQPWLEGWTPNAILLAACAMMPLVFLVRGIAMWSNAVLVNYLGLRILQTLQTETFAHLQKLPLSFHDRYKKGDLISRVLADTQSVQTMITQVANDIVKQPATALGGLAAFIYLLAQTGSASMFLMNLFFVALVVYPILNFGRRITTKSRRARESMADLGSVVQQNLASQREVRAYGMEQRQINSLLGASARYCTNMLKMVKYQRMLVPVIETVTALALAFILVRGRQMGMNLTDFTALAAALYITFDSTKKAGSALNRFSEARASLERLEAILDEPDGMPDPAEPKHPVAVRGGLDFCNVNFAYDAEHPVLQGINLSIPPGQIVGLVGPSGAGKTTFASLIPRFYEATEGAVLLDGIDVRDMTKQELRSQIALVSQHALLFHNTIRENIRLGRPEATDADVDEAARAASVGSFLTEQPEGIDTMLGEGGGLSGGQRQRVAIARAFLKDAPVLILDEATASLDAESERAIQSELEHLARGRTTLIVAHRFSTIRMAHRILVFDRGRIVGDGTHSELYAGCPLYRELYDRQGIDRASPARTDFNG